MALSNSELYKFVDSCEDIVELKNYYISRKKEEEEIESEKKLLKEQISSLQDRLSELESDFYMLYEPWDLVVSRKMVTLYTKA